MRAAGFKPGSSSSHSPKAGELRLELRAQVLETCRLPLTNSPENAEGRTRTSEGRQGQVGYSHPELPLSDFGETRNSVVKQQKERVLSALKAQKRPAPLSLLELVFEISGAGVRSRWINAGVLYRRTGVLPISWYLWYSRSSAY